MSPTRILKSAGYSVQTAVDAADALKALRLDRPDVLLVDINLSSRASGPVLDGFNVIDWLNYHYPGHHTQYIIVSAGDPEKLGKHAAEVGAFAFIRKPVAKDQLLTEIRRATCEGPASPECEAARSV